MIRYALIAFLASLRKTPTLYLLSLFGVAMGVASVLTIQIINRNALAAFEGSVEAISGPSDATVLPYAGFLADETFLRVLGTPGVAFAYPVLTVEATLARDSLYYVQIVGTDLSGGRLLPWADPPEDTRAMLADADWAAPTARLAEQRGWRSGETVIVNAGSRAVPLVRGATTDFERASPTASSRIVLMDIAAAQTAFGLEGKLGQIEVVRDRSVPKDEWIAGLRNRVGDAARVVTQEGRREEAVGLLRAFRLNLTVFSLVSLFVGGFLVYTSVQNSLFRRRREFGLLRSIGASRGQMVALLGGEVAVIGLLGTALGLALGAAAAHLMMEGVSGTLTNLYLLKEIERIRIEPFHYALALVIGLGGACAGGALPIEETARRDPRALLAAFDLHEKVSRAAPFLFLVGIAQLAILFSVVLVRGWSWPPGGFIAGASLMATIPLTTPYLVRVLFGLIPARSFGAVLGLQSLRDRLPTTAPPMAALALAIAMLLGITLLIGSFRETVAGWIDRTMTADIYISPESWTRGRETATIEASLADLLRSFPGVAHSERVRQVFGYAGERRVSIVGADLDLPGKATKISLWRGDPARALSLAREEGAVLVSEPLARKENVRPGDSLSIRTVSGPLRVGIAGVYYDYSTEGGGIVVDMRAFERTFGAGDPNTIALYLEPGLDPEATIDRLKAGIGTHPLLVRSNRALREEVFRIFDQTFAVTRILQAIALLVASSGILLTLTILARERKHELALFRSLGANRAQIFRLFLGKGIGMALFGLLLGTITGIGLAFVLVYGINVAFFGWSIELHWPWRSLAAQTATIILAAMIAAAYPALQASRTPAKEMSREDV